MDHKFIDRLLKCSECGKDFVFTAGEQLFFCDKQFKNDPKRCKPCKVKRSVTAAPPGPGATPTALRRTETQTECSTCGIQTTVPFKPTQGRPVLCRECFQARTRGPIRQDPRISPTASPKDANAAALSTLFLAADGPALSSDGALLASSSMSNAQANSSVATAEDLASISGAVPNLQPRELENQVEVLPSTMVDSTRREVSVAAELVLDLETMQA